jgi:hypothetical protein
MKLVRVMESENEFTDQCGVIVEENKENKQKKKKKNCIVPSRILFPHSSVWRFTNL